MTDAGDALLHAHAEAVENGRAARLSVADQARAGRIGNHVGDDHPRAQVGDLELEPRVDVGNSPTEIALTTMSVPCGTRWTRSQTTSSALVGVRSLSSATSS